MSFITKRERVFNEYDLVDLPPRNEGRLKAYASCTDARAWSHFCSSKSEHLADIIKRNNDTSKPPKYVPTKVIVDTIMVTKNLEIARLKRRIGEFEQMLAVYEDLELDCDQKCEIAKAHAIIKAENKNLDDMCLDLNVSGFTEGMDSDAFETGKSRGDVSVRSKGGESDRSHGDEWTIDKEVMNKANQTGMECPCDASVSAHDPRIEEMQEEIVCKDAKLNAMRNTLAIMENDVCEPYGIYAHIYTALEKIYGILSHNSKYKQYLNLMTAGKDTRCIDIKGKILFKLKVLEKFCLALIAPCSKDFNKTDVNEDCSCYRAEVITKVEKLALKSIEINKGQDGKRAQLVADIMENEEMKEILSKESSLAKDELFELDELIDPRYDINEENQKRIKDLQESYEELLNCYENLKHENECLRAKCSRYEDLEAEVEYLRTQLREYGALWNEKEHYRKRSEDLDTLKEKFMILAEESSGLESRLKAEAEINQIKASTIEDLKNQNIDLERRLTDFHVNIEKEKNALQCKLHESECKCICQEQQIKSLSAQIMQLLEHEPERRRAQEESTFSHALVAENETLKRQIKNFQDIEEEYQDKLSLIEDMRQEIKAWKNSFEKASERNKYLEECVESQNDERIKLLDDNEKLMRLINEKTMAVENLMQIIKKKSQEIDSLMDTNQDVSNELQKVKVKYDGQVSKLESEKTLALKNLQLSRQESQELLQKVRDYNDFVEKQEDLSNRIEFKMKEYESMKRVLKEKIDENERLKRELASLQSKELESKQSMELTKKESLSLEQKLCELDNVSQQFMKLKEDYNKLINEKNVLEHELKQKAGQLDSAIYSIRLNKKESGELLKQSESIKEELIKLNAANRNLVADNDLLHRDLDHLRQQNEILMRKITELSSLEQELSRIRNNYNDLLNDKKELEHDFRAKTQELSNLYNTLKKKIDENRILEEKIKSLQKHNLEATSSIKNLENENLQKQTALNTFRRQSSALMEKLQHHESLESEYNKLKTAHEQITLEKERLQRTLDAQLSDLKRLERENLELNGHTNNLLTHNSDLEAKLISTRNQLLSSNSNPDDKLYADIMQELQKMKEEKNAGRIKIRELMDTLDISENQLSNLQEQVLARDDKIAIMQNHINQLEDEVRRLHEILAEAVATSGDIKDTTHQKLNQSMQQIEAHHSKATHNIKMELAMLQNSNAKLEDQLSMTKLQNKESSHNRQKLLSQITNFRNEREIIVTDIKQLELSCAGDSELMPENCGVEHILASLDRIRNCFDARESKSTNLEQTLQKVQNSSQLLLGKADEAKKYLEKEKQKIINEKEDAIKEKLNLEQQIAHDKNIINDLEREILNQKLIYDKINDSTQSYISKLEEEMHSLQDLYQNSISKICELQERLRSSTTDNENMELTIQKLNQTLQNKCKEVAELQAKLEKIIKKPRKDVAIQSIPIEYNNHISAQTDQLTKDNKSSQTKHTYDKGADSLLDIKIATKNKHRQKEPNVPVTELLPQQKPPSVNEVQILAAEVEPTFDFVKSSYLNYKIKRLGPGQLQHHSIPCEAEDAHSNTEEHPDLNMFTTSDDNEIHKSEQNYLRSQNKPSSNLIDIYNGPSNDTNKSSKLHGNETPKPESLSLGLTNDSFRTESISNIQSIENQMNEFYTSSDKSKDKDVLVIFKESESNFDGEQRQKAADDLSSKKSNKKRAQVDEYDIDTFYFENDDQKLSQHKRKLDIDLPQIGVGSTPLENLSDDDKKSLDSFNGSANALSRRNNLSDTKIVIKASAKDIEKYETPSLPTVSNDGNIYDDSQNSTEVPSGAAYTPENKKRQKVEKKSLHKLARVGADVYLMKNQSNQQNARESHRSPGKQIALDYILDSVKREGHLSAFSPGNTYPEDRNDDIPNDTILIGTGDSSPSAEFSISPTRSKTSEKSRTLSVERSVMVKLDGTAEYYETIIRNLRNTLDNVEKEYKKKIEAIKVQYDRNINNIINEHNQGVKNIQSLHEETLQDIMRLHENEVDNLRSMSMDAMRKADKLEKENMSLKTRIRDESPPALEEIPFKVCSSISNRRKLKVRHETKCLTKTMVESFNVKPKMRLHGPCTCSLDVNISDTIRNIFEQVDVEQRKLAELAYLKYITGKISDGNIQGLDAQELSFLHLKVCRTWKSKLSKEEALQKKIDSLEVELINKQRNAQQHMAELDRKVAEEKRRLEEVREAVCRAPEPRLASPEKDFRCPCTTISEDRLMERRSAGDLATVVPAVLRQKKPRTDSNRAVLAKLDTEERRERKLYSDEPPTRLRRQYERPSRPTKK